MRSLVAIAFVTLAVTAPAGGASDFCHGEGAILDALGVAYVAVDELFFGATGVRVWVYVESNGDEGLQRGGVTLLGAEDTCQDSSAPDTGVF